MRAALNSNDDFTDQRSQIAAVPNQENEQFFTLKIAPILQPLKDIMPDENPLRDKNPFGILSNDALIAYLQI